MVATFINGLLILGFDYGTYSIQIFKPVIPDNLIKNKINENQSIRFGTTFIES